MAQNHHLKNLMAALFFFLGLAAFLGIILFIGVRQGLAEPRFRVTALFDQVGGLIVGAPVRLSGVTVGSVRDISFLEEEVLERAVRVDLELYRRFRGQIARSTRIAVLTEGVLGSKYIEISRKPGEGLLDLEAPVLGEPMLDVYDLAEVLESTAGSFQDAAEGISTTIEEVEDISRKTKRLMDRIERRVIEGNLFKVF
ncbi:MAG: MCE family protein [Elusimicrobia bacterium]|nr:MCE family protein [Elusimicrobiota bacterium]